MARRGFTLVEAAVAIAVVSILAGMMAPLALRILDQRREAATRGNLKRVFEALFGARDRRVANMRADFGFDPPDGDWTLRLMVDKRFRGARSLHINVTPDHGAHPGTAFRWGWNGPYWLGDLKDLVPIDAWGSPILLRVRGGAAQVYSPGPTKRDGPDSLVYPPVPIPLASLEACVNIHVAIATPTIASATLRVRYGGNGGMLPLDRPPFAVDRAGPPAVRTFCVPAGGMEVVATYQVGGAGAFQTQSVPLDLLPGETRDLWVNL